MIGIVFCNTLDMCPYASKYIDMCEKNGIEYEVIIWNREGNNRKFPNHYRVFNMKSELYISKWKKLGPYIGYSKFVNKTIKEQKYEKLIILTTLPAVFCYSLLTRKYKKKYIFDFRDLSFEGNPLFRNLVRNICRNSYFTCISSPGFSEVLGRHRFIIAHNFRHIDLQNEPVIPGSTNEKINLLHIGITRGEEYNKRLVDIFGNDERFNVYIVGRGNDTPSFIEYAKQYPNIYVYGTYDNENKEKFVNNADMLLYYYPCDFNCNRALANKYYDGLIFKKPLVGNIHTYSGRRIMEKGIGISLDISIEGFAEKVYSYITELDKSEYLKNVEKELSNILREDHEYLEKIKEFMIV